MKIEEIFCSDICAVEMIYCVATRTLATEPHGDRNYVVEIKMNAINNFVLFVLSEKGSV